MSLSEERHTLRRYKTNTREPYYRYNDQNYRLAPVICIILIFVMDTSLQSCNVNVVYFE